jgi:ribonuclease H2 subunit A
MVGANLVGADCRTDDQAQPSAASWFGADADSGRPKVWRELGVAGVGEL